jgi:hypothetical protein
MEQLGARAAHDEASQSIEQLRGDFALVVGAYPATCYFCSAGWGVVHSIVRPRAVQTSDT